MIDLSRLNTFLLVERFKIETPESIRASLIPGEWVSSIDLSDAYLHIPIHSIKEVPTVFPQFSSVPVHLTPFSLYNDCKSSEADGPHKRSQTSPISGRLAYQGPIPGGGTSEHSDRGRPNTVLGVDNQSREVRTQTHSGVFIRGLQIPFSPCINHSRDSSNFRI